MSPCSTEIFRITRRGTLFPSASVNGFKSIGGGVSQSLLGLGILGVKRPVSPFVSVTQFVSFPDLSKSKVSLTVPSSANGLILGFARVFATAGDPFGRRQLIPLADLPKAGSPCKLRAGSYSQLLARSQLLESSEAKPLLVVIVHPIALPVWSISTIKRAMPCSTFASAVAG